MFVATISITPFSRASLAGVDILLRTASSAHCSFLPRSLAMLCAYATASLVTFSTMVSLSPSFSWVLPILTGWAAPIFVPGAMAAMSEASVMMAPADAARAPLGET